MSWCQSVSLRQLVLGFALALRRRWGVRRCELLVAFFALGFASLSCGLACFALDFASGFATVAGEQGLRRGWAVAEDCFGMFSPAFVAIGVGATWPGRLAPNEDYFGCFA
jgi:hypothetical protein